MFEFKNTSLKVTVDEFPPVVELLSPGLVAVMLTPPDDKFSISNALPKESDIVAVVPVNELTNRFVVYVPKPFVNEALPTLSPIIIDDIVKEPASVENIAFAISVSPAS